MPSINPQAIREGDRLALSKALTAVENGLPESQEIQAALFSFTGQAHLLGITGSPGSGKSTLVNQLAKFFRCQRTYGKTPKIAIVAVDPTSPFSGGALLGDRIRMQDLSGDKGIFIRSMASRGALGGLAHTTAAFATVLDGAGFDMIIIETVGAGQAEVEIASLAHTTIVVETPGMGDDIQAIKAGILEIGDILVVNKADQPGAENAARALQVMLEMGRGGGWERYPAGKHMRSGPHELKNPNPDPSLPTWQPPIQLVTATDGTGVEELASYVVDHKTFLKETGLWQIKESHRLEKDLEVLIQDLLLREWLDRLEDGQYEVVLKEVVTRKRTPIDAAQSLIRKIN